MLDLDWKQVLKDALVDALSRAVFWISIAVFAVLITLGEWLLTAGVTVPGWLAGLLLGLLAVLTWAAWPRLNGLFRTRPPAPEAPVVWEDLDVRIMHLFWLLSESSLDLDYLDDAFKQEHRFRIRQAADRLVDRGMLETSEARGASYRLTSKGRDFCVGLDDDVQQLRKAREADADRSQIAELDEGLNVDDLTEREVRGLKAFAVKDGSALADWQVAEIADQSNVWGEAAIEDLERRGLVKFHHEADPGNMYKLTSAGKRIVLEEGWA